MLAVAGIGHYSWLLVVMMPADQRCTQGSAGIAGRRVDVELLEGGLAENPAVRHAVERDAAGETEAREAGPLVNVSRHREQRFFGHRLERASDIHVPLCQLGFRLSRRTAEQTIERAIRHPETGHEIEVASVKPE